MDQRGYLGLFRKFFDEHEFWKEKRKYSRAEAWIDLMQSARYGEEPETLFDKRGSYVLEYADVYISLRYLGERWQWSKNKVSHFLEYLKKRESILFKKRDSHRTIIHIINLKGYTEWIQGKRDKKDSEGTVKGQSRDSEGTKKKKVKKEKKVKTFSFDSTEYKLAIFFVKEIRKNNPEFAEPNMQAWARDFDNLIRVKKREPKIIAKIIKWVQADNTPDENNFCWAVNVLSPGKLIKQYDQLLMRMNAKPKGSEERVRIRHVHT